MLCLKLYRALLLLLCAISCSTFFNASAQTFTTSAATTKADVSATSTAAASEMDDVRRQLREQQEELQRMRAILAEQSRLINELLRGRVEQALQRNNGALSNAVTKTDDAIDMSALATSNVNAAPDTASQTPNSSNQDDAQARLARVEAEAQRASEAIAKQLGTITFSGDLRLQYDAFFNQLNALPNAADATLAGNELSSRNRFRVRARLAVRGRIGKEFDWGLRLSTGSFANVASANQILTDFYTRKPFALDQAFIAWTPPRFPGLRVQGGKFETPWAHTELTIDNDVNPEGFSETFARDFKSSALKNLTFVAWQLPFLERNSAFVRNANGTVNVDDSQRAGRDLALYGAQLRARLEPSRDVALTLSVADLYFSGTQFITPVQFFNGQLQLPLTITIPATANAAAQTVTTQISIPRELLVAGNGNLGLSSATNNATNRDGRLASGFNLVDAIARLDLKRSKRYPLALILNFVANTQARDVTVAADAGANTILMNNENKGYWIEFQMGRATRSEQQRGDLFFGYTFIRIEKDAVLTPFNFDDLVRQSDVRAQRFVFAYAADPRVTLTLTGLISQRANGLLGRFGQTPPGSLNRPTVRLQFDTIFRF